MMKETIEKRITGLFSDEIVYTYHFIADNGMEFHAEGHTIEECRLLKNRWMKGLSAAFTGHRIVKIPVKQLRERIADAVHQCYRRGIRFFYAGGAMGFDALAAEEVLKLKKDHPDVILMIVVPFREQADRYPFHEKQRYQDILSQADEVCILSESYFPQCYFKRNDYLVSHSSELIAYWDNTIQGGTSYTVRKALDKKMKLHNLY